MKRRTVSLILPGLAPTPFQRPSSTRDGGGVAATPLGSALAHDHTGRELMAFGPCGRTAWVLVPVADRATVSAIHERYGERVIVTGWLRRLD